MKGAFGLPTQIITLLFNTILEDSRKCGCINMFLNAWARILGLMTYNLYFSFRIATRKVVEDDKEYI